MKKLITAICVISSMLTGMVNVNAFAQQEYTVYVSEIGNDSADGTESEPVKTIDEANQRIAQKSDSYDSFKVIIGDGTYLTDTINLNSAKNITYESSEGAVITNAVKLDTSKFSGVTDQSMLQRLPQEVQDKVVSTNLSDSGVSDYGRIYAYNREAMSNPSPPQLIIDGRTMSIAHWPNTGYAEISNVVKETEGGYTFNIAESRATDWESTDNVWVYGCFYYEWNDDMRKIASVDSETGSIRITSTANAGMRDGGMVQLVNAFEELDTPGEWYVDKNGVLYVYPESDIQSSTVLYSSNTNNLVNITDSSNISFKGITFTGTCANAMDISNSEKVKITDCDFKNIGRYAIAISNGRDNIIQKCKFSEIGKGGVDISGGDTENLTCSNNLITNCEFEKFSVYTKKYSFAVKMYGVGDTLSHCKIHDASHFAVQFLGNNNIIAYNDIYDVLQESKDAGAIYAGRSWVNGGSIIWRNHIHDCIKDSTSTGISAIYLDDWMSGITIHGNVISNMNTAVSLHTAQYCNVTNNLLIDCSYGIRLNTKNNHDAATINKVNTQIYNLYKAGTLRDNYKSISYMGYTDTLFDRYYDRYNPENEQWNNQFPYLKTLFDDGKTISPKYDVIKNNIMFSANADIQNQMDIAEEAFNCTVENNIVQEGIPEIDASGNVADKNVLTAIADKYEIWDVQNAGIQTGTVEVELDGMSLYNEEMEQVRVPEINKGNFFELYLKNNDAEAVETEISVSCYNEAYDNIYSTALKNNVYADEILNNGFYFKPKEAIKAIEVIVKANGQSKEYFYTKEMLEADFANRNTFRICKTSLSEDNGIITVNALVCNRLSEDKHISVIAAGYSNGKLLGVVSKDYTMRAAKDIPVELELSNSEQADTIKLFVWDYRSISPQMKAIALR